MNNEYIKALGQIPELVETTKLILADNDKRFVFLAEAVQKRMKAEIPISEINKVSTAVSASVANTRCIMPDVSIISQEVAKRSLAEMVPVIRRITVKTVQEAIKDTPVRVEHVHTHTTLREMTQMANEKLRIWFLIVASLCIILLLAIGLNAYSYYSSGEYLGQKYAEIATSKLMTNKEKELLLKNCYSYSFLPLEYIKDPKLVKTKIKRNQLILDNRKAEAKTTRGKYSTRIILER